jgi:hypothetical protein
MTKNELIELINAEVDKVLERKVALIAEKYEEKMYASLGRKVIADSGRPLPTESSGRNVSVAIEGMRKLEGTLSTIKTSTAVAKDGVPAAIAPSALESILRRVQTQQDE